MLLTNADRIWPAVLRAREQLPRQASATDTHRTPRRSGRGWRHRKEGKNERFLLIPGRPSSNKCHDGYDKYLAVEGNIGS